MPTGPAARDRAASIPLAALGVLLLARTHGGASGAPLQVLTAVLGALAVVSAARMWCRSCFDSHLLGLLVAIASTGGQLLAVVIGPPGGSTAAWSPARLVIVGLGASALLLLAFPLRRRRTGRHPVLRPYAR